jgi:hypothetical protein
MSPPLTPDADEARRLLESELSKPEYFDTQNWIADQFDRLVDWLTGGPGTVTTMTDGQLAALIVGVLALAGLAVWAFMGPLRGDVRHRTDAVLAGEDRTAADLRADAGRLAASDEWGRATLQVYRAIVRSLSERAIIEETTGMTAHEAATRAIPRLPGLTARLIAAAEVFDALAYGNRPGSRAQYEALLALDSEAAAAQPRVLPVAEPDAQVRVEAS